jgi:DNA-binding NtrC family response regulator
MKKTVLVVEDITDFHSIWQQKLADTITILSATTIEEAADLFSANPSIDAIALDACVPGDDLNTLPLLKLFKRTFNGPIIAISGSSEYRETLVKHGCTHECQKRDLPQTLSTILFPIN